MTSQCADCVQTVLTYVCTHTPHTPHMSVHNTLPVRTGTRPLVASGPSGRLGQSTKRPLPPRCFSLTAVGLNSSPSLRAESMTGGGVAVGSLLRRYYALFFSRQRSDGAARNQTDGPREPPCGGDGVGGTPLSRGPHTKLPGGAGSSSVCSKPYKTTKAFIRAVILPVVGGMAFKLDAASEKILSTVIIRTNQVHGYDYCLAESLEAYAHEASNRGVVARGKQCCKKTGGEPFLSLSVRKRLVFKGQSGFFVSPGKGC